MVRHSNATARLDIEMVENGCVVHCIPFEQGVVAKQFVFREESSFGAWMAEWFKGNSKVTDIERQ